MELLKTYVYRHGRIDELIEFLNYELKSSKNVIKTLYTTLEYHNNGVADYFIRPIHRMDNKTLLRIYNLLYNSIQDSQYTGLITEAEKEKIALWALKRIYLIQNNSKLLRAIQTYDVLK